MNIVVRKTKMVFAYTQNNDTKEIPKIHKSCYLG